MSDADDTSRELINKQYEFAILLIQYHIQLLWLIFGAFLLAETVLLGVIGSLIQHNLRIFVFYGSIFGFVLIFPWLASFRHNYSYYRLRIEQAKQYEKRRRFFKRREFAKQTRNNSCIRMPFSARILVPSYGILFFNGSI